jgi:hypothetical protein
MPTRDTLHRLIDELPESELPAAECFLQYLRATADPVQRALLDAPLDDAPETAEERRSCRRRGTSWCRVRYGRSRRGGASWACALDGRPDRQCPTSRHPGPSPLVALPSS